MPSCLEPDSVKAEKYLNSLSRDAPIRLTASFKGDEVAVSDVKVLSDRCMQTELFLRHNEHLEGFHMGSPGHPALYGLTIGTFAAARRRTLALACARSRPSTARCFCTTVFSISGSFRIKAAGRTVC